MNDAVNLEKLLISNPYGSKNEFESVATFEESDPYIRWLSIDFALENEAGSSSVFIYGEAEKADDAARLFGALILLGSFAYNSLAEAMHGFRSWSSLEPDTGAVLMLPIAPSIMPPDPAAPVHRR